MTYTYNSEEEEAELADRYYNDDRLEKAIQYLNTEGSGDAIDLYLERVQIIDEHILQKFPAEGKSFDPGLYRQLRSLVREVQNDVQDVNEDSLLDLDSDFSVQMLYRDMEDDESEIELDVGHVPVVPSTSKNHKTSVSFKGDRRTSLDDDRREKRFLYGGPNNEPERWFKGLPPILPFGESPYMEKWESMKINYDLIESAKKKGENTDSVITNVPYDDVEKLGGFKWNNQYDSGSRFKLPANPPHIKLPDPDDIKTLAARVFQQFNDGGSLRKSKGYVPRIVLPLVDNVDASPLIKSAMPRLKALFGKCYSPRPENKFARPHVSPKLKKFQDTRNAAIQKDEPKKTADPETIRRARQTIADAYKRSYDVPSVKKVGLSDIARLAKEPKPQPSTAQASVEPGKRRPGRPSKNKDTSYHPPRRASGDVESPTDPDLAAALQAEIEDLLDDEFARPRRLRSQKGSVDPTYRPSQSPLTPTKRQRDENLPASPETPTKRPRRQKHSHSGHVEFAGEAPTPAQKATLNKRALPTKSTIKTSTRVSAEDRAIAAELARTAALKRGTLRSNKDYKPQRLRSR